MAASLFPQKGLWYLEAPQPDVNTAETPQGFSPHFSARSIPQTRVPPSITTSSPPVLPVGVSTLQAETTTPNYL